VLALLPGSADAAPVLRVAPPLGLALCAAPLEETLAAVCGAAAGAAGLFADSRKMLLVSGKLGSVAATSAGTASSGTVTGTDTDGASSAAGSGAVSAAMLGGGATVGAGAGSGGSRSRLAGAFPPAARPLPARSVKERSDGTVTLTDMSLVGASAARAASVLSGAYQSE
jgi:hypothetical protein